MAGEVVYTVEFVQVALEVVLIEGEMVHVEGMVQVGGRSFK